MNPEFKGQILVNVLRSWLLALKVVTDEIALEITEGGWLVRSVDSAHVCLIDSQLKRSGWPAYKLFDSVMVGLDIEKIIDFLNIANKDDVVNVTIDQDSNKCIMQINNVTKTMAMIDQSGYEKPKIPAYRYEIIASLEFEKLTEGIKRFKKEKPDIAFTVHEDQIKLFDWKNNKMHDLNLSYDDILKFPDSDDLRISCYYWESLSQIAMKGRVNGGLGNLLAGHDIEIALGHDSPIRITSNDDARYFTYLLAPSLIENALDAKDLELIWDRCVNDVTEGIPGPADNEEIKPAFEIGQCVISKAGQPFTVTEIDERCLTVIDDAGRDYQGLHEAFIPASQGAIP